MSPDTPFLTPPRTLLQHTCASDARGTGATPSALLHSVRHASRKLDKAASKGVIHKNRAANRTSAMAAKAAQL